MYFNICVVSILKKIIKCKYEFDFHQHFDFFFIVVKSYGNSSVTWKIILCDDDILYNHKASKVTFCGMIDSHIHAWLVFILTYCGLVFQNDIINNIFWIIQSGRNKLNILLWNAMIQIKIWLSNVVIQAWVILTLLMLLMEYFGFWVWLKMWIYLL